MCAKGLENCSEKSLIFFEIKKKKFFNAFSTHTVKSTKYGSYNICDMSNSCNRVSEKKNGTEIEKKGKIIFKNKMCMCMRVQRFLISQWKSVDQTY